jgi:hypothetical protein
MPGSRSYHRGAGTRRKLDPQLGQVIIASPMVLHRNQRMDSGGAALLRVES